MATKKQIEQMAKLAAEAKKFEAMRRMAQRAMQDEKADAVLKASLGHRKAESAKDAVGESGGGKRRNIIRRIAGL